jgi:hypothetical protein
MNITDSFLATPPQRAKRLHGDLETAMAELLELRARVEEAAKFTGLPSCKTNSPSSIDKRNPAPRRCERPHNRTR